MSVKYLNAINFATTKNIICIHDIMNVEPTRHLKCNSYLRKQGRIFPNRCYENTLEDEFIMFNETYQALFCYCRNNNHNNDVINTYYYAQSK